MVGLSTHVFNQTLLKLRLAHTQKVLRFRFKADYDIIIVRKKDRIEAQLMIIIYARLCVRVLPSPSSSLLCAPLLLLSMHGQPMMQGDQPFPSSDMSNINELDAHRSDGLGVRPMGGGGESDTCRGDGLDFDSIGGGGEYNQRYSASLRNISIRHVAASRV